MACIASLTQDFTNNVKTTTKRQLTFRTKDPQTNKPIKRTHARTIQRQRPTRKNTSVIMNGVNKRNHHPHQHHNQHDDDHEEGNNNANIAGENTTTIKSTNHGSSNKSRRVNSDTVTNNPVTTTNNNNTNYLSLSSSSLTVVYESLGSESTVPAIMEICHWARRIARSSLFVVGSSGRKSPVRCRIMVGARQIAPNAFPTDYQDY